MKANTRFSITPASTHVDNMQTSTENENQESFDLKKSIQQHIGETYQYAPIPMERLHPSPSSVHLDADGIVGKAHEILPTRGISCLFLWHKRAGIMIKPIKAKLGSISLLISERPRRARTPW